MPRKWKDSTVLTGDLHRVMGVSGAVFFLKSTTISTVLRALSYRLFWLHQVFSFPPIIRLPPEMSTMRVVSIKLLKFVEVQLLVYKEKSRWERTQS